MFLCVRYENDSWKPETTLEGHADWIRDVSWAPNIGLPVSTIASCSQVIYSKFTSWNHSNFCFVFFFQPKKDGTVMVWQSSDTTWKNTKLPKFPDVVWSVSWSITGNILAISGGDNKVTLWKETDSGWNVRDHISHFVVINFGEIFSVFQL